MRRYTSTVTLLALSLAFAGCSALAPPLGTSSSALTTSGIPPLTAMEGDGMTLNGLSPGALRASGVRWGELASMSLSSKPFQAMLSDPATRDLLTDVVRCATQRGQRIGDGSPAAGVFGRFGLDQSGGVDWVNKPLAGDLKGQRWASACLIAVLNGLGETVPIRLTGNHEKFHEFPLTEVTRLFAVDEISVFGNVFDTSGAGKHLFVCSEKGMESSCNASAYMQYRICGKPGSPCGVEVLGSCDAVCPASAPGARSNCKGTDGQVYEQVITVKLEKTGFMSNLAGVDPQTRQAMCPGMPLASCGADTACPAGTVCEPGRGCRPELCGVDEECRGAKSGPVCIPDQRLCGCASDSQCGAGRTCVSGGCRP